MTANQEIPNSPWQHHTVELAGLRQHYVTAGAGKPVLLHVLHGFPETWYAWRKIIPALAARYFVVAPRTVNLRMQSPGTATLAELQKLAVMAKLDLLKVLELAAYQLEHPRWQFPRRAGVRRPGSTRPRAPREAPAAALPPEHLLMQFSFDPAPPTLSVRGMLSQMAELLLRYPDDQQRLAAALALPTPTSFWPKRPTSKP